MGDACDGCFDEYGLVEQRPHFDFDGQEFFRARQQVFQVVDDAEGRGAARLEHRQKRATLAIEFRRDSRSGPRISAKLDGERGALLSVLKTGSSSTLRIIDNLKSLLPRAEKLLPVEIKVRPLFDQSVFVKAAISGVVHEALVAAGLTAALILIFLGNWRSTLIVAVSIPLSILASLVALDFSARPSTS